MIYEYHCWTCDTTYDVTQSIHDEAETFCRACGGESASRVLFPPTIFDATPRTVGTLAERNSGAGRSYWLDKQRQDSLQRKVGDTEALAAALPDGMTAARTGPVEKPWWRPTEKIDTRLTELTPQQTSNFIVTGSTQG